MEEKTTLKQTFKIISESGLFKDFIKQTEKEKKKDKIVQSKTSFPVI